MNSHDYKKKISEDHEAEEKIFRAGSQLYTSCASYDLLFEGITHTSLDAVDEFEYFIKALLSAGRGKNFIAREKALQRLLPKHIVKE